MSGIFASLRQATVPLQAGREMHSLLQFKSRIDHMQSKNNDKIKLLIVLLREGKI
jgi:hypothetical protein